MKDNKRFNEEILPAFIKAREHLEFLEIPTFPKIHVTVRP